MSTEVFSRREEKENNIGVSTHTEKKMSVTSDVKERKTLKTLQLSSDGRLIGSEKSVHKNRIVPSKKPVKIFPDTSTPKSVKTLKRVEIGIQARAEQQESQTQTDVTGAAGVTSAGTRLPHDDSGVADAEQEAYDLMVKDPVPENYWRELAEERRLSLAEALSENEMLHQSMEELKEENHNLSLLAGQAEHLAAALNSVLGGDDDDNDDNDDNNTSNEKSEETPKEHTDSDAVHVDTDNIPNGDIPELASQESTKKDES